MACVHTWNKFDKKAFQQDLLSSELCSKDADLYELTVEDLFSKYDSTLWCLLDKHLPVYKVRGLNLLPPGLILIISKPSVINIDLTVLITVLDLLLAEYGVLS